jgi:hypothetical protein
MVINAEPESLRVPLDERFLMQLRPSEVEAVVRGLGEFDSSATGNVVTLAAAVRSLPLTDRAPLWELAMRRYGRGKPLEQAAGSIGMDVIRARALLGAFGDALRSVPPPETTSKAANL